MEKLTFVGRYDKKKDGTPLVSKAGKPYTSVRIKTEKHGDQYLSGFGNKDNADWKVGDEVEIEVEQKGEYLNFTTPKKVAQTGLADAQLYQIKQASESAYAGNLAIQGLTRRLEEAGVIKPLHAPYPERDATNDMHQLDADIEEANPF